LFLIYFIIFAYQIKKIMEKEIKKPIGRPKKEKDSKTLGIMIPMDLFNSVAFKEKTRYLSSSKYILSLIEKDLKSNN